MKSLIDKLHTRMTAIESRESGVTLMLAILILAAITAIAFSLSTIVFIEIRSSGDVLRTEPALYAVQGVTEEALFAYKRNVPSSVMSIVDCTPQELAICSYNSVLLMYPAPTQRAYDVAPRVDTLLTNASKTYLFIDAIQPNSFTQAYKEISVTYLNNGFTGNLHVVINRYDSSGGTQAVIDTLLVPNGAVSYTVPNNDEAQYEMIIVNQSSGGSILASIDAVDVNNNHRIPLIGQRVLDITASYLGITRKYTVNIPVGDRARGISLTPDAYNPQNGGVTTHNGDGSWTFYHPGGDTSPELNINGFSGVLSELGFDYLTGSYCTSGAPRFNVFATTGPQYYFGCGAGTHTDLGNGYTRVRFTNSDAVITSTPWPGFGYANISNINMIMDEPGTSTLKNIDINGVLY